ncbi:putative porin [Paraburkholderia sp. BL18I3N2]|uniref:porin n=1 Tax=Paraburkholderia sp. BL18I3N2 TaxID=1938799 RepID=UPI000D05BC69|nr:porin [Paraburkholderia sp. BL18I3N2]PRX23081.1 putative porin [Paraburkholderia sp. BL18I3N2]
MAKRNDKRLPRGIARFGLMAALAAFDSNAPAQSGVSLYGEIDASAVWVKNVDGGHQFQLASGLIDGSFWGMQGSEDLGGGSHATFHLERGFSVTTGADQNDHPYYVGLANDKYGALTLGHQYDSIHDYLAPFTLTGGNGGTAFAHPFDNDNANNSWLARNSVKYTSSSFDGLSVGGMYAFSNAAGQFADNRAYSIGANYGNGDFSAGAAWLHADGRGGTEGGAYDAVTLPATNRNTFDASVQTQNTFGIGASQVFGPFTLAASWTRSIFGGITDTETGLAARAVAFDNYEVNGTWEAGASLSLGGMYTYTKGTYAHWNQGALQADYTLTKRTDTYIEAIYQCASAGASAVINSIMASSRSSQLLFAAGIRHHF